MLIVSELLAGDLLPRSGSRTASLRLGLRNSSRCWQPRGSPLERKGFNNSILLRSGRVAAAWLSSLRLAMRRQSSHGLSLPERPRTTHPTATMAALTMRVTVRAPLGRAGGAARLAVVELDLFLGCWKFLERGH